MAETAALTLPRRETLHALRGELTAAQRVQLATADAHALTLHARHQGQPDPYFDIRALGDIVAIIESERATAS